MWVGTINTFTSNQVEERRIRGNRRRSRRSRGTDLTEQKYKVDNPSALLWTGIIGDSTFVKSLAIFPQESISPDVEQTLWGTVKA